MFHTQPPFLRILATLAALGLSACASYHARPLAGTGLEAALAGPDRAALVERAGKLHAPGLAPVKLDFTRPLTSTELAVIAVLDDPDLIALRARQKIADAQVFAAGLLPDPQLSAGFDFGHIMPAPIGTKNDWSLGLGMDLSALYLRASRVRQARAQAQQVRLDIAWAEWQVAGQARLLGARIVGLQHQYALARHIRSLQQHLLQSMHTASVDDALSAATLATQQTQALQAQSEVTRLHKALLMARQNLNQLLGFPPDTPLRLAKIALDRPAPADPAKLFAEARRRRLDLRALKMAYASREAAVRRAVLGQYPRLTLTLNRIRDNGAANSYGPAVSLTLPLWNRNRGAIRGARASRTALRLDYRARLQTVRADLYGLVTGIDQDRRLRRQLAADLPTLQDTAARQQRAAARGDLGLPSADAGTLGALRSAMRIAALQRAIAEQQIALQIAVGAPTPSETR